MSADFTCNLPDSLDSKIETLLRDWHHSPDLLFSIHPIDGSFLIWYYILILIYTILLYTHIHSHIFLLQVSGMVG